MPRASAEEGSPYPLPQGVRFPGQLIRVNERVIEWRDRSSGEARSRSLWRWTFEITGGQYEGLRASAETDPRIERLGRDPRPYNWLSTLRDAPIELGEDVDTDDFIGLPCMFTVTHEEPRVLKDGRTFYGCPVNDVFPADSEDDHPPY